MPARHRDQPYASSIMVVSGTVFSAFGFLYCLVAAFDESGKTRLVAGILSIVFVWMIFLGFREIPVLAGRWNFPRAQPILLTVTFGLMAAVALYANTLGTYNSECVGGEPCVEWRETSAFTDVAIGSLRGVAVLGFAISAGSLGVSGRSIRAN